MSYVDLSWTCDLWFFATKFECKVFFMFLYFLHGLLLFYPPYFKCNASTMHHVCNVFCEVKMWAWKYELWTLCINTQGHYNLASRLVLHNLQHITIHLLLVLVFGLLSFKVCMSNLYSSTTSTTNGCLEVGSSYVLFAHFWWVKGNPEFWANWKA
jgi:hypothetical protein